MPAWNLFSLGIDKDSVKNYIYILLLDREEDSLDRFRVKNLRQGLVQGSIQANQ